MERPEPRARETMATGSMNESGSRRSKSSPGKKRCRCTGTRFGIISAG